MHEARPLWIPTASTLITFESAGRHGNFTQAAKELRISQPSVSRNIASLEKQLATRLFHRSGRRVVLTEAGKGMYDAVVSALDIIHSATVEATRKSHSEQLVIACSNDAAHCYVMPQFDALRRTLSKKIEVRILSYQYDIRQLVSYPAPDVVLGWNADIEGEDSVLLHLEAVVPVCSPQYLETHSETLNRDVSVWGGLTFLELTRSNEGWSTWEDWFQVVGRPEGDPVFSLLDSYQFVLQLASNGDGLALGSRHFIEPFLKSGALVAAHDSNMVFTNRFCGQITESGRNKSAARACLSFFQSLEFRKLA